MKSFKEYIDNKKNELPKLETIFGQKSKKDEKETLPELETIFGQKSRKHSQETKESLDEAETPSIEKQIGEHSPAEEDKIHKENAANLD